MAVGGVDDIGLDLEVDRDEFGRVGVVGVDAADLGGGEDDVAGAVAGEEVVDGGLAGEVEVGVGAEEEVVEAEGAELVDDGGADEAAVAGDEDRGGLVGGEGGRRWS